LLVVQLGENFFYSSFGSNGVCEGDKEMILHPFGLGDANFLGISLHLVAVQSRPYSERIFMKDRSTQHHPMFNN